MLLALLPAGSAHAQASTAELVSGRISYGFLRYEDYTRFDQLVVWNANPGDFAFLAPIAGSTSRYVSPSGIVDFSRLIRRVRLGVGREFFLALENYTRDAAGAYAYPFARKLIRFRVLPRRVAVTRQCYLIYDPLNPEFEVDCAAPCPPPPALQTLTYCQGAGALLPAPRFAAASRPARGGGVRISRLQVGGLPLPPPFNDATVVVICNGRGCPLGARVYAGAEAQRPLDLRRFRGRVVRPGAVIEIQVVKGNAIGRVQRYRVRRRGLTATSHCLYPTRLRPQACPAGQLLASPMAAFAMAPHL
jgi:hypothetical protein